jgi:hypothetical protein
MRARIATGAVLAGMRIESPLGEGAMEVLSNSGLENP